MGVQINGSEGNVIATKGTFSGDVGIGGTLTYEDVTNIDSVGLVTARSGIEIGARPGVAASISVDGNMIVSGISTFGGDIKTSASNIVLGDSSDGSSDDVLIFGAGSDLKIYHTGSQSRIENSGTGELRIQADDIQIVDKEANDFHIKCVHDGAVELYYDNSKKFETTSEGNTLRGTVHRVETLLRPLNATNTDLGTDSDRWRDLYVYNSIDLKDSGKIKLGDGDDIQIYHSGSNSFIKHVGTGDLYLQCDNGDTIYLRPKSNEDGIKVINDGAVELYFNNSLKFKTDSTGCEIAGALIIPDGSSSGNRISVGNAGDLKIYHDGSDSFITNSTGGIEILNHALTVKNDAGNETILKGSANGAVELYHNNVKQINTHPNGIFTRGIYPMSDNSFSIGSGSERYTTIYATNGSINTSDENQKNTIIESDLGLDFVNQLKPVSYKWNEDDGKTHYGLIAQDVEKTLIDIGKTVSDFGAVSKEDDSPMGLGYSELISPLIKAVQELSAKNDALTSEIQQLKSQLNN